MNREKINKICTCLLNAIVLKFSNGEESELYTIVNDTTVRLSETKLSKLYKWTKVELGKVLSSKTNYNSNYVGIINNLRKEENSKQEFIYTEEKQEKKAEENERIEEETFSLVKEIEEMDLKPQLELQLSEDYG